jgi:hypothetical protein
MSESTPEVIATFPRVTWILETTGISDFAKIPNGDFYKQRGADVHMITADIDNGRPDYWTGGDLEGYAKAWIAFKQDTQFNPLLVESPVHHEQRQYRGTLDRVGTFGSSSDRILLDIKAGIVADWVPLQTAAYASCLPEPQKIKRCGVQLKKDGHYAVSPEYKDYRRDSNTFFCLVATVHARTVYGKFIQEKL